MVKSGVPEATPSELRDLRLSIPNLAFLAALLRLLPESGLLAPIALVNVNGLLVLQNLDYLFDLIDDDIEVAGAHCANRERPRMQAGGCARSRRLLQRFEDLRARRALLGLEELHIRLDGLVNISRGPRCW